MKPDDVCPQCGHLVDPHVLIATTGDSNLGGIMLWPEGGCQCICTWSAPGKQTAYVPEPDEIAQYRASVQRRSNGT